jgi:hypothetical protein
MNRQLLARRIGSVLCAALIAASCSSDAGPLEPAAAGAEISATSGTSLLVCPTNVTQSTTGIVGLLGGTLELDGTSISIPAGAVSAPTLFTLTLPASQYMEVKITAAGFEQFRFDEIATITISYDRCNRTNINRSSLSAWYIDSGTKALLEYMGGFDDKLARTVTFGTDHLSGYSIAE